MTMEETVWSYLRGKGLGEKATAAVMGNIYAESGFDPTLVEAGNGIGLGLCQWSFGRRDQLEAYGIDLQHQEDFLWSELTGENTSTTGADFQWINRSGYLTLVDFRADNGSIEDLTSAFCFCWERPNADLAHLDVRQQWANTYFTQFTGTIPPGGGGGGTGTKIKLKNRYIFNHEDSLYGVKFSSNYSEFEVVSTRGNCATIKDASGKMINVNKKNIINV